MKATSKHAVLDAFRVAAAFLVVAIHVSPLQTIDATADFIITRIAARVAVPFFLMISGYFLAIRENGGDRRHFRSFLKKTAIVYGAAIVIYLPLNYYTGYFNISPLQMLKDIFFNGTFYHLWYLPAVLLGALIVIPLWRRFGWRFTLVLAAVLYVIGLGGDSYYGLVSRIPALKVFYDVVFSISDYTRNGVFLAPVFIMMGVGFADQNKRRSTSRRRKIIIGLAVSAALLVAEALWLRGMGVQRHDSMYLMLLPCMYFLFALLSSFDGKGNKNLRTGAMAVYILHPWAIVLVRAFAKLTGTTGLLVENQLMLYILVCIVSAAAAAVFICLVNSIKKNKPSPTGRAWVEIDLKALIHNAAELQKLLPASCRLMAVVKADGYGHGAVAVARALEASGISAFAAATLGEGIALRRGGVRGDILIFGCTPPADARLLRRYSLMQTVVDGAYAQALHETGAKIDVHIKIDTGMRRLGIDSGDLHGIERIFGYKNLTVKGMLTHLSEADNLTDSGSEFTLGQISAFFDTAKALQKKGYDVGKLHAQESYGILNYPDLPCDYARAGIALYGVLCKNDKTRLMPELRPVLSLKARVAEVKWIGAGEPVSYNRTFVARVPTKIATVSIGYADGVPRNTAQREEYVLLRGLRAPIIGRICMDLMVIDVTGIEDAGPGDIVTIIGRDGEDAIRCEDMAESCGTITNEILSRLGARLPRIIS
ncbi:MAG: serine racemase VanT catalytic subunit [Clostridiales bacterium]|nr:serine racemase VanT catalytic subunit [Clostridiales bacterium]